MVEPISLGAAVAKLAISGADEGGKAAAGTLSRLFGPAAGEVGEALRRWTAYRVGNVQRIVEVADGKSRGREGTIAPRLAHALLEGGSFCDDELMAEYLGGVLAGGRTPSGRDDRAVAWSNLITSMSVLQLRAHFIIYRELAHAMHGRTDAPLIEALQWQLEFDLFDLYRILRPAVPDICRRQLNTDHCAATEN